MLVRIEEPWERGVMGEERESGGEVRRFEFWEWERKSWKRGERLVVRIGEKDESWERKKREEQGRESDGRGEEEWGRGRENGEGHRKKWGERGVLGEDKESGA